MTELDFNKLASQGYTRVPVVAEARADLYTPLAVYAKLAQGPFSYLLESVVGGERFGRYSFIGLPARTVLRVRAHLLTVETDGQVVEEHTQPDPLAFIADFQARFQAAPVAGLPRFTGGLVGTLGYDSVRFFEPRLAPQLHHRVAGDAPQDARVRGRRAQGVVGHAEDVFPDALGHLAGGAGFTGIGH